MKYATITLNPAIDRTIEVDDLRLGEVVRGRLLFLEPAGKGVNAAHTLSALGCAVAATGFVGRNDAQMFKRGFAGTRVTCDFVKVDGITRESLTILDRARDQETHLTEQGFEVTRRNAKSLIAKTAALATPETWVGACGRPAPGFTVDDYAALLAAAKAGGARLLADTSGDFLPVAVEHEPDIVKPNDEELAELVGKPLRTQAAVLKAARELANRVRYVVVSLGGKGALCVTRRGVWHARERGRVPVVHTVGCGDTLAMGFMAGISQSPSPARALKLAVAAGGACARSPRASLRARNEVDCVLPGVDVKKL